jgi:hypothetical protein
VPDFKVTPEIINEISGVFNIAKEKVQALHRMYQKKISSAMKRHYLAHIIRTMEDTLRNLPGNEMFRIICTPVAEDSKDIGIACSHYYKGRFFAIYYHPKTNEKQLRIMLAHELGHIFFLELVSSSKVPNLDAKTVIELSSTVMGIFTILDKNEFYHNGTAPFKHASVVEVLNDFKLLHNRNHNVINIP